MSKDKEQEFKLDLREKAHKKFAVPLLHVYCYLDCYCVKVFDQTDKVHFHGNPSNTSN